MNHAKKVLNLTSFPENMGGFDRRNTPSSEGNFLRVSKPAYVKF